MTNDLVTRLRHNWGTKPEFHKLCCESAELIESLQAHGRGTDIAEIKLLHEQVEQLQAELKSKDAELQQFVDHAEMRTREIERYRAALEEILWNEDGDALRDIAREALGEE